MLFAILSFVGVDASELEQKKIWDIIIAFFQEKGVYILVIIIIVLILMVLKYRNSVIIKMVAVSKGLKYLTEETIEVINDMEAFEEISQEGKCEQCSSQKSLSRKLLNSTFINYTIHFLDEVSEILTDFTSYEVSTSLKIVVNDEKQSCVVTLARDSKSDEIRSEYTSRPVPIELNTDFATIINGDGKEKTSYFYVSDLEKYSKNIEKVSNGQFKYLNSTPNWWKYYKGTIVVPIVIGIPNSNGKIFNVCGFLCADSLSTKAFTKQQKTVNIKLMKGFAGVYSMATKVYHKKLVEYSNVGGN